MRTLLLALLFSAACDRGFPVIDDIYKIRNQDKALIFMEGLAEDYYGLEFGHLFERTKVYWVDAVDCPYTGEGPAIVLDNLQCVGGIMYSCMEMYVATYRQERLEDYKVCGTALLHEFGHCIIQEISGGWGDAAHTLTPIWGGDDVEGIVEHAYAYACERGW